MGLHTLRLADFPFPSDLESLFHVWHRGTKVVEDTCNSSPYSYTCSRQTSGKNPTYSSPFHGRTFTPSKYAANFHQTDAGLPSGGGGSSDWPCHSKSDSTKNGQSKNRGQGDSSTSNLEAKADGMPFNGAGYLGT
ncbi:hypothetical protein IFR05_000872, partial [Cadophora sp. M221]